MQTYLQSLNNHLGKIATEQQRKRNAYARVVKLAKSRRNRRLKKWRGKHKEAATVALWRKNLPEDVVSHIAKFVPFNKPLSTSYANYGKNTHPKRYHVGRNHRLSDSHLLTKESSHLSLSSCTQFLVSAMERNAIPHHALCRSATVMNWAWFGAGANHCQQPGLPCHNSFTMLVVFRGVIMAPHYYGPGFAPHHCKILKDAENALLLNTLEGGIDWHK